MKIVAALLLAVAGTVVFAGTEPAPEVKATCSCRGRTTLSERRTARVHERSAARKARVEASK